MSKQHLTDIPLASFEFPEPLLRGIQDAGFHLCTPIQARCLPIALAGHDVAGQAQTGTGKTAAYLLATMTRLLAHPVPPEHTPRALIIAPTRELAVQIHKDAELLGKYTGLRVALIYGGAGYETQRKQLEEGVDIVIGTPGRLIDYHRQHVFDLRHVEVAVVDEADRMFDLGFIKDIRYLLRRMPKPERRLCLLFSATLSLRVLSQFEQGEIPILVATDVAARGLHIPGVTHVINFDLPQDAEDYVHRIGRTARAGASGDAINFVCETYAFSLPEIEKYIGHAIPSASVDPALLAAVTPPAHGVPRHGSPARRSLCCGAPRRGGGGRAQDTRRPRRPHKAASGSRTS